MSWHVYDMFFKTPKTYASLGMEEIPNKSNFDYDKDHLYFSFRNNGLGETLKHYFSLFNNEFNLAFLTDYQRYSPTKDIEDTKQIIYKDEQDSILQGLDTLLSKLVNLPDIHYPNLTYAQMLERLQSMNVKEINSQLDVDNEHPFAFIAVLELLKRFFKQSLQQDRVIVYYTWW